jgi:hypothetical protein
MKKLTLILVALIACLNTYSRRNTSLNKSGNDSPVLTAGCATAVAKATIELNNVRTRIEGTGGSMWQDRANSLSDYEVPKRGNVDDPKYTAIYAGALWMGGQDVNGQLKIAAVTFRSDGNDFWPGPLNTVTAEIDAATCVKYDRFYGVSLVMILEFNAWFECSSDPDCDETVEYPGYQIPQEILDWPAHGDISLGQDWHLAPFYDRDGDDFYDPNSGDYPKYDLINEINCRTTRDVRLFGDTTIWFVFNDKGNIHQESNGPSIGMEIRGQAFAFATNNEINDMTFYNYEMINRSTFTLTETYFGQWVDADLGNASDDFVGCDASRGLGYCYNGDNDDENANGGIGYGQTPPAIGVDFFEGPYADFDGLDNPLTTVVADAIASNGIPYKGLGIGYGDGIVDNERYGMRKFVYYTNGGGDQGDPSSALDHYNYLRGIWADGSQMVWGGTGHSSSGGTVAADILFPGDSDPLNWSTQGNAVSPSNWSEHEEGNQEGDRRFLQSAGPFTLEPGAVNDLTVGVVYARANSGDNIASISALKVADDKAQSLFDNCFKIVEGPDAPNITFQELDKELILYLTNPTSSNNYNESYNLLNTDIAIPDTMDGFYQGTEDDRDTLKFYKFQGYQIFQVKNASVTVSEIFNVERSRLLAQVDIKDGVEELINYGFNSEFGINVPLLMVEGEDQGIKHSFRITKDLFATDNNRLVNHRSYYYIAIAYGYNEYKKYDGNSPVGLDGQKQPYIASRKMAGGRGITSFSAIPHNPAPENGGTKANSEYGDMPQITRVEGQGNGGNNLELTSTTEAGIVANGFMNSLVYKVGKGPIQVKVIDPLNVKAGTYRVQFKDTLTLGSLNDAFWTIHLPQENNNTVDSINSDQTIELENEQILLSEGLSVTIGQVSPPGVNRQLGNGVMTSEIVYSDVTKQWLGGFSDQDNQTDANWIRSGENLFGSGQAPNYDLDPYDDYHEGPIADPGNFVDPNQDFENLVNGTWAPYRLLSSFINENGAINISDDGAFQINDGLGYAAYKIGTTYAESVDGSDITKTPSVDIVFTSDKSKWSRAMVMESRNDDVLATGGAQYLRLRESLSVDKNGVEDGELDINGIEKKGMGWFPGYAINIETGERLNIAFAEDSWLAGENGRDMLWNPTSTTFSGVDNELLLGGKHYVYVFRSDSSGATTYPAYDECSVIYDIMSLPHNGDPNVAISGANIATADKSVDIFTQTCVWAGIPMVNVGRSLLETDAKIKLRVEKSYEIFHTSSTFNAGLPLYEFDMTGFEVELGNEYAMDSALLLINVVPNPYFAYSEYENNTLDKRIKITNLPKECTISIYNVNGTLMRRFQKADEKTSLDWELTNQADVPIASGVYLIHVKVPGVGERTLKWYGVMKPTDLNGFN